MALRTRRLVGWLLVCAAIYLVLVMVLSSLQEQMIFYPETLPDDFVFRFSAPFEEVLIDPEPGVVLHALHFSPGNPRGLILYFHGNAGRLRSWGFVAEDFLRYGFAVLVTDYRRFGKSRGPLSEKALLDDAMRWFEKAEELADGAPILVYGRSIGTGPAAYLATQRTPHHLVLETPFTSMTDLARHWFPWAPAALLDYKLPVHSWLGEVSCPVTLIHGTDDEVVPYRSSERLSTLLKPGDRFITVPGGGHNDLAMFPAYREMLDQVLGREPSNPER
jgi:uncharacterized protein